MSKLTTLPLRFTLSGTAFIMFVLSSASIAQNALQCSNENTAATATTTHLHDNEDGTISDPKTGLVWKKCSEGQSWDNINNTCTGSAQTYNWQQALQQAQDVNAGTTGEALGESDWRVPNINELPSIAELRCYSPAVNQAVFPNTPSSSFWSSSPYAPFSVSAWGVFFLNGSDNAHGKSKYSYVRLVRSGQ